MKIIILIICTLSLFTVYANAELKIGGRVAVDSTVSENGGGGADAVTVDAAVTGDGAIAGAEASVGADIDANAELKIGGSVAVDSAVPKNGGGGTAAVSVDAAVTGDGAIAGAEASVGADKELFGGLLNLGELQLLLTRIFGLLHITSGLEIFEKFGLFYSAIIKMLIDLSNISDESFVDISTKSRGIRKENIGDISGFALDGLRTRIALFIKVILSLIIPFQAELGHYFDSFVRNMNTVSAWAEAV